MIAPAAETTAKRKARNRNERNRARTAAGMCYECNRHPYFKGRRCEVCASRKPSTAPRSPEGPVTHPRPPSGEAPVRLLLLRDDREGYRFQRRDASCARLLTCEEEWIRVYLGANIQARCPEHCRARKAIA